MKAVVYSCAASFAVAVPSLDAIEKFGQFRAKWGHNYVGAEYQRRAEYFEHNLQQVELWQRMEKGTAIYTHLGPFADFSPDEKAQQLGFVSSHALEYDPVEQGLNNSLPSSFDWVMKGAVNPIKNQGNCGSCWAFSTACNLESTGFVSSGKLVSLSEQYIVDCDTQSSGCGGGDEDGALEWSSRNGGVPSERSYPYTARDGSCRSGAPKIVQNQGAQRISKNEDQIAQALVKYGALSIAVDASGFNGYSHGVMRNPSCSTTALDHAINIVGYGQDEVPYWKVRNSWGTGWGEDGYIRLSRGDCTCGVCTDVATATGVTVSGAPPSPPGPSPPTPPGPSPPGPCPVPPSPSPVPPGPSPCNSCEWNSQCPNGQDCYYPSSSASSGCCAPSDPYSYDYYGGWTEQAVIV